MNDYWVTLLDGTIYRVSAEANHIVDYFDVPCTEFLDGDDNVVAYFPLSAIAGVVAERPDVRTKLRP